MSHPTSKIIVLAASISALFYGIPSWADTDATGGSNASEATNVQSTVAPNHVLSIGVFGKRITRQVSDVKASDFKQAAAGSSPFETIRQLPGVNFNQADALGAYEWGSRISIRGFNQNQLGFTLDDIPLGDMSYRNYNGLHISRAIISENIKRADVSEGVGAINTASVSNLGGTVQFYSRDPEEKAGAELSQTLGSDKDRRTFVRLDTGRFGNNKFTISFADQNADKWKGDGEQKQQQVNAKWVSDFDNAKLTAFVNWSNREESDYMDLSKDSVRRLGYNWDYYTPNWQVAINSANGVWSRGETSSDDAYFAGSGLREDWLSGISLDYDLTDHLKWKTTLYDHHQDGTGTWWAPNPPASTGILATPIALRTLGFNIQREGILSSLNYDLGIHHLQGGVWYEHNNFDNSMRFYSQDNGPTSIYNAPPSYPAYYTRFNDRFRTNTVQLYAEDDINWTPQLTTKIGFKSPRTTINEASQPDTAPAFRLNGKLTAQKTILPQLGINYKLGDNHELFADFAQNLEAYRGVIKGGASPFDTTQAGFDAAKRNLKPEQSSTVEAGWRFHDQGVESSLAYYHVEFRNRLLALQQGAAIQGNPSVLVNVGGVSTDGLEGFLAISPINHVQWKNSLSFNNSRYQDDFTSNGTTYGVKNKTVVDSPRFVASSTLSYDDGQAFGHVGVNYTDKRYYSYTNDASVSGYSLVDLGAGYRWRNLGYAKELTLNFNVNNLLNKKYFAFGDNPFPTSDPQGQSYNLLAGAPRSAFLTLGAKF